VNGACGNTPSSRVTHHVSLRRAFSPATSPESTSELRQHQLCPLRSLEPAAGPVRPIAFVDRPAIERTSATATRRSWRAELWRLDADDRIPLNSRWALRPRQDVRLATSEPFGPREASPAFMLARVRCESANSSPQAGAAVARRCCRAESSLPGRVTSWAMSRAAAQIVFGRFVAACVDVRPAERTRVLAGYLAGGMLALSRNTFCGSQWRLIAASCENV
jgi:hypothetical protein